MSSEQPQGKIPNGLIEFFFWFLAITTIKLLLLILAYIRYHEAVVNPRELFYRIVGGNILSALIITLLNRLLQHLLRRRG